MESEPTTNVETVRVEADVAHVHALNHTDQFDVAEYIVVRRGTPFPVQLISKAAVEVEKAVLTHSSGNEVRVDAVYKGTSSEVELAVPVTTPVGVYNLTLSGKTGERTFQAQLRRKVFVLFNAWSKNDSVYIDGDAERQEYVLKSDCRLFVGDFSGMPWNLALYRPDSLRAVALLLSASSLKFQQFADPIHVSRDLSGLVNEKVVEGKWDSTYTGGRSPTFWRGSGQILQQYYQSQGSPVKYGQCWVFSGVLLSTLRVLGIPSRSITNFNSAHDTNHNRTVDQYYNDKGEEVEYLNTGKDTVWNFHCWNEVHIQRPDLHAGFEGWQVVDSTPQEESPQGGGYCLGPTSLKAVKEGHSVNYDTDFVIAEVNADIKKFILEDGAPRLFQVDTTTVGKDISTKAVGSDQRVDVTDMYKYPDGSDLERHALYSNYKELVEDKYEVSFHVPEVSHRPGSDIAIEVHIKNCGSRTVEVCGHVSCSAVMYTGKVLRSVDKKVVRQRINVSTTEKVKMEAGERVFTEFPGERVYLLFDILLVHSGTTQVFEHKVYVGPTPPKMEVQTSSHLGLGEEAKVTVQFTNPLPFKMEAVSLNVENDNLLHDDLVHEIGDIGANATIYYTFNIIGLKVGTFRLVIGLGSDHVQLVTGEAEVTVTEAREGTDGPASLMDFIMVGGKDHQESLSIIDTISGVDLSASGNRRVHQTDRYDSGGLIVRRGQSFTFFLLLGKSLPSSTRFTSRATFNLGTRSLSKKHHTFQVDASAVVEGSRIRVELTTPTDAPIGRYYVVLTLDRGGHVMVVEKGIDVIILFNPWCTADTCHYLGPVGDLEEYILSTVGKIWIGTADSSYGRPWQHSQFMKDTLEVALSLLEKMKEDSFDPVKVSQYFAARVNSQDGRGILVNNVSGDYSRGKSPHSWVGSAQILSEYRTTKCHVKYGQCWVSSGVLTSLLRSIGIPTRSVTIYGSACSSVGKDVIQYFTEDGRGVPSPNSVWQFHVLNEVYIARPDLPKGFSGWQVLDASPPWEGPGERGVSLGPAPQLAVKRGVGMHYNVERVAGAVSSQVRAYLLHKDKSLTLASVDPSLVGRKVCTKAVGGSLVPQNLTVDYKSIGHTPLSSATEVSLGLGIPDDVIVGSNFAVKITLTNMAARSVQCKLLVTGQATTYTGDHGHAMRCTLDQSLTMDVGEVKECVLPVESKDYLWISGGEGFLKFVAMAITNADGVRNCCQVKSKSVRIKTPDIAIDVPTGALHLYKPVVVKVKLVNTLGRRLTNGVFHLHGGGHVQDIDQSVGPVSPWGPTEAILETVPLKKGRFQVIVRFTSDQLVDLIGDFQLDVLD